MLIDTSVWIDHFRSKNASLEELLEDNEVLMHPFVRGELACGNLKNRKEILQLLNALPKAAMATDEEVISFLTQRKFYGKGIGWVDAHLMVSALLDQVEIFTLDQTLAKLSSSL